MKFGFCGPSYTPYSTQAASQRTVNLFPEIVEQQDGKSRITLYGTPGLTELLTPTSATIIKTLFYDTATSRMFAVTKRSDASVRLVEFNLAGTETDRGQLAASGGTSVPASISSNGTQLLIINPESSETAHIFTLATNTLSANLASSIGNQEPAWGQFLDGYFIVLDRNGKFYLSALNDGTTWDATDVATPESSPDKARMILADRGELWIFGDDSIEIWINTGNADFPFEPIKHATIQQGIIYTYSAKSLNNAIYWVGRGRDGHAMIWRADGYQPQRVSNHAVEQSLQNKILTGAVPVAFTRQIHGHQFYVLTFPDDSLTWEYDATMPPESGWHELMYLNGSTEESHRGRCSAFVGGENGAASALVIGDRSNGKIYTTSMGVYDDDGDPIRRERRAQHFSDELKRLFFRRMTLEIEAGAGDFTLEMSEDGGATFGTALTGAANYSNKMRLWKRLGSARDRVFRVRSTAAIKHAWIDAYLDQAEGMH